MLNDVITDPPKPSFNISPPPYPTPPQPISFHIETMLAIPKHFVFQL
jgi:hypothetical protein